MKSSLLASAFCLGIAAPLSAATINFAGSIENNQVNDWRTAATTKTLDVDADNIYGTFGAVHWLVAATGEQPQFSASAGWAYHGGVTFGQFRDPVNYAQIDTLNNPTVNSGAGIMAVNFPGTFVFEMTGTPATYAGMMLRVGVMADVLTAGEWAADVNKTFQLTGPGGGDSGVISLRGGGAGNGQPEMYFFDITGVNAGDLFTISANGPGGGQPGYIGPVSWDLVAAVPEPSAALLGGLAGLALLRRRRA